MAKPVTTVQPDATLPAVFPVDAGAVSQLGLVGVLAFLVIRVFLKQHTDQQNDSWHLLEKLVATQQETLKTLANTNQELTLRLARVHERLEHIERCLELYQRGRDG